MTAWQQVTEGLDQGGYVAWEAAIDAVQGDGGRDHVPVFVTLQKSGAITSLAQAVDATLALPDLRMSAHERDLLATERALAGQDWPHEVRLVAFWPRAKLAQIPDFWRVLQVGPPLRLPPQSGPSEGVDLRALQGDLDPAVPVAAVIDDGIGFVNARRRDRGRSRMRAVWLQAPETLGPRAGDRDVVCGQVVLGPEIDAHLSAGGDEATIYAGIHRTLLPVTDPAPTARRAAKAWASACPISAICRR